MASQVGDRRVLAGEWDYIDSSGAVVPLILDEQGKGRYEWKEGRFETRRLMDHTWSGKWVQKENDREGGFRVKFSPDFSEGEGQWWYSRIGNDKAPTLKGGSFQLRARSKRHLQSREPPLHPSVQARWQTSGWTPLAQPEREI